MTPLQLGVLIWIAVMPLMGMLALKFLADSGGKRSRQLTDQERNLAALTVAVFWPGALVLFVIVFVVLANILAALVRMHDHYKKQGGDYESRFRKDVQQMLDKVYRKKDP